MPRLSPILALSSVLVAATLVAADDPVFSGPQAGEKLTPFKVITVYGDNAGKEADPVALMKGKPAFLIFIHKLTRPGIALTRGLTAYANANEEHGATAMIVWLDDDKAKAEAYLNRAKPSLKFTVPVGVSVDGGEGPGAYGLNRNVEQTILIVKDNKVAANFALVQPSVSEAAKIAAELAKLIEQPAPTAEQINKLAYPGGNMMRRQANTRRGDTPNRPSDQAGDMRKELMTLMRTMFGAQSDTELRDSVVAINDWAGTDKQRLANLGRMSGAALQRGIVPAKVQKVVQDWKDKHGPKDGQPARRERPDSSDKPESKDRKERGTSKEDSK